MGGVVLIPLHNCRLYRAAYNTLLSSLVMSEDLIMQFKMVAGFINYRVREGGRVGREGEGRKGGREWRREAECSSEIKSRVGIFARIRVV